MRQLPLVSVIIPTYNRAEIIVETIENVFQQTYPNLELIVVDDGSTDKTKEVLASYKGRIRWISQPNAGPSAARNHGLALAKGEIIAFQDSDDSWHPKKIERQVFLLERAGNSVPCCLCNVAFRSKLDGVSTSFENAPIDPPLEEGIWTNVAEVLTTRFILINQAAAVRKSVLDEVGGFDESLKFLEDHEFALRLAMKGPWAFIRTPLVYYGLDSINSWSQRAVEEELVLNECHVRLRQSILKNLTDTRGDVRLQALMGKHLKRAQGALNAVKMLRSDSAVRRLIAPLYVETERLKRAVDRRLPGYPTMEIEAIAPAGNANIETNIAGQRSLGQASAVR